MRDRWLVLVTIGAVALLGAVVVGRAVMGPLLPAASQAAAYSPLPTPGRMLQPGEIEALFRAPASVGTSQGSVDVAVHKAGELRLPSGRVVASDAFFADEPFTTSFEPGSYPVLILRVNHSDWGPRVAAALVRVSDSAPVRWVNATLAGQDVSTLRPGEVFVYGVDSGTGCFTSPEAVLQMNSDQTWMGGLMEGFYDGEEAISDSADLHFGGPNGPNIVAFHSGFGDGGYPSFFGFDASGRPVALLTDFGVLDIAE